jgi:hypothetical protein
VHGCGDGAHRERGEQQGNNRLTHRYFLTRQAAKRSGGARRRNKRIGPRTGPDSRAALGVA